MSLIPRPSLLSPGSTIGILGGGQLGRMLAHAAARMGYHTHIYSPEPNAPAFEVSTTHTIAAYDDTRSLSTFARTVDVITYEFENIPLAPVQLLASQQRVFPSPEVLATCQHRIKEKEFVRSIGINTAPFVTISSLQDLERAASTLGTPYILKTATMGYDGKGQVKIQTPEEAKGAWESLHTTEAILEGFVSFVMEASVIVARNASGEVATFPLAENIHRHHILHQTVVPARTSREIAVKAEQIARTIAGKLGLIGILAVEMFITANGDVLVNELAPRPHNSGHWSIDACITSQFEQTIRAICNLPLGATPPLCKSTMINLIGDEWLEWQKYIAMPNAKLHLYGKTESRPGRKMGHVTLLEEL